MLLSILALSISSMTFAALQPDFVLEEDPLWPQQASSQAEFSLDPVPGEMKDDDEEQELDDFMKEKNILSPKTAQDVLNNKAKYQGFFEKDYVYRVGEMMYARKNAINSIQSKESTPIRELIKMAKSLSEKRKEFLISEKSGDEDDRNWFMVINTLQKEDNFITKIIQLWFNIISEMLAELNKLALKNKDYANKPAQHNIIVAAIEFLKNPKSFESAEYGISKKDPIITKKANHLIDFASKAFGIQKKLSPEVAAAVQSMTTKKPAVKTTTTKKATATSSAKTPAVKTTAAKTLAKLPADIKELKAPNMRITRHDIVNLKKSLDAEEIGYYTKVLKEGNAEQKRWAKQILYHDARIKKKYKK